MLKLFKAIKSRIVYFFSEKTLLERTVKLENRIAKQEKRNRKNRKLVEKNTQLYEMQEVRVALLEEELKKWIESVRTLGTGLDALKEENKKLGTGLDALKEENKKLGTGLDALKDENKKLRTGLDALKEENKKFKKKMEKLAAGASTSGKPKGKSAAYQAKLEETIKKVVAKTGVDHATALAKFLDAEKRTGCTPKEYYLYRMYDMTDAEQETVLVASIQKYLQEKFGTNKDFVDILYDKERTNDYFAEYIRRPWCVNTKISCEEFVQKFQNSKRVIYKPLAGNRGRGVEAFEINNDTIREVYGVLSSYPEGVVEQYVVQHAQMLKLCPSSVNTIRVVTFSSNSTPVTADGKYMDIAYTSLRIGGGGSIVDNFHSGGMVAHIDQETGRLITDAADMECNVFTHHPVTGVEIKGFQVPYYKEVLAMVTEAITKNKVEGYLGFDVAIAEDGPILIEVNDRPGVVLLSTPYAAQKKGMKHVLAKYL